ncbi:hypothetical protein [Brevibacillus reuszeri]|uniref:hypothetical protein n=1 Tax=Brevibacillus reuszeri TaxID=54915 RepID=UPI003D1A2523
MDTDIWRNKDSIIVGLRFIQEWFPNHLDLDSAIKFIEKIEVPVLKGNLGYAVNHVGPNKHELIVQEHTWDDLSECYQFSNEKVLFICDDGVITKVD